MKLPANEDHLGPSSWRGNVQVKLVSLQTCWNHGRLQVLADTPAIGPLLSAIDEGSDIDLLQPFGKFILSQELDIDDNKLEDDLDPSTQNQTAAIASPVPNIIAGPCSRELEDALATEDDTENGGEQRAFDRDVEMDGKRVNKARALAIWSQQRRTQPGSTDRLKRVQQMGRYDTHSTTHVIDFESAFGQPCLMLNEPIAVLIRCERRLFLGIGEVIDIHINSESIEQITLDLLMEDTVTVTFQLMTLTPASTDDDPTLNNDW